MRYVGPRSLLLLCISIASCTDRVEFRELPLGLTPETELVAQTGKREKLLAQLKQVNLLFFGYTRCPDFCPLTLHKIHSALEGHDELQRKLSLIFVSVDPREQPANLHSYLAAFPYARGFTGASAEIKRVEKLFGAHSQIDGGSISHSLYLYLLNKEGRVIYLIRYDEPVKKLRQILQQAAEL